MSQHIKHESRVQNLQFAHAWKHLTEKEKNYAYYMNKANWEGAKMVPHQVSYESPVLFAIFLAYFKDADFPVLEKSALQAGVSQEEWNNFIAYVGGFYGNMSNYHSFGHMKFTPDLPSFQTFQKIL